MEEVPIDVFKEGQDEDADVLFERLTTNVEGGPNGRPFNWLTSEEEIEAERARREANRLAVEEEKAALDKNKMEQKENEERNAREKQAKKRMDDLQVEERDALSGKSIALRNYLNENVIPTLTEGLIETCKILPEDPLDYLAEYLFKHSNDIKAAPWMV